MSNTRTERDTCPQRKRSSDEEAYVCHFGTRDERRRAIRDALSDGNGSLTLCELARAIHPAVDTRGESIATILHLDRLLLDLHHRQLPRMDEAGLLEYVPETRRVESTDPRRIGD